MNCTDMTPLTFDLEPDEEKLRRVLLLGTDRRDIFVTCREDLKI